MRNTSYLSDIYDKKDLTIALYLALDLTLYLKNLVPVDNITFFQQPSVSPDILVEYSIGISIMVQVICLSLGQKIQS